VALAASEAAVEVGRFAARSLDSAFASLSAWSKHFTNCGVTSYCFTVPSGSVTPPQAAGRNHLFRHAGDIDEVFDIDRISHN